jgi:hypothetical protein
MPTPDVPDLDALADAVAARLAGRLGVPGVPGRPAGLPAGDDAGLLPGWIKPEQLEDGWQQVFSEASVGIDSVEFTQSTQFNSAVTPGYGTDNSVPLVAHKMLVVRVYPGVRSSRFGRDRLTGTQVTGDITLAVGDRILHQGGPTRVAGARIGRRTDIDRTRWDSELTWFSGGRGATVEVEPVVVNPTLNFVVPAYWCQPGRVHVRIRLWPVADGRRSTRAAAHTEYVWFETVGAPKVCLVRINWTNAAGTTSSPTDAQMLGTLALAERMLPFPYLDATILGVEVESSATFWTPATNGGCNVVWTKLVAELNVTRIFTALFGLGDIVYGLVPTQALPPAGQPYNSGCGIGAGGGYVDDGLTFAHELGHLYGRPHVNVAGDPFNDTNYPRYGGDPQSIGEVGIDTGTTPPTIYDPSTSDDIMSYGSNQWISPYTYRKILDARGIHVASPIDRRRLRTFLVLSFRLHRAAADAIDKRPRVAISTHLVMDAPGFPPAPPADAPSPVSIDLLDADHRILTTHHCRWIAARAYGYGCGCADCGAAGDVPLGREPWLDFTEVVEWPVGEVAAIAFHDGGDPIDVIEVGELPTVAISGPEEDGERLRVRVEAGHARAPVSVVVLFSADQGETWQVVATEPKDGVVSVDRRHLPGSDACRFRAVASAELMTATADTAPFAVAPSPRAAVLALPADAESGCSPLPPGPVPLRVLFDNRGLGAVAPHEIIWTSSLDGDLGRGHAPAPTLSEGRHQIVVSAPDGLGGRLEQRGIIVIGGAEQRGIIIVSG